MSTYWKGACHDCRQWIWLSNADAEWAESCFKHWTEHAGHIGHNTEFGSEYDEQLNFQIDGLTPLAYLGWGDWKTERNGEPYTLMNEDDGFAYNMSTSAPDK